MTAQPGGDRRAMLAKVHIAKKHMALADDDYRAVLLRVTGHSSSVECSDAELHVLLSEFKRLGWKETGSGRTSAKAHVRKVYAIWHDMRGLIEHADDDALRSFVQRQTKGVKNPDGIGSPEWLDPVEANKVIEGLKAWRARLLRAKEAAHAEV
jgi:Protein of unknown function (DUF1018)